MVEWSGFRNRSIGFGSLHDDLARECGATGFVERAAGRREHDFRLNHPYGLYRRAEKYRELLAEKIRSEELSLDGDVFARVRLRIEEAKVSAALAGQMLDDWPALPEGQLWQPIDDKLRQAPNFVAGLGYAEGWRGGIVYWVMKDKFERIYRCKVCDPSILNWPALRAAVIPHRTPGSDEPAQTLLADFPLVNKSFNLSYSANDL